MNVLTRTEESILLAVWRLKDNAYGVTITEMLSYITGKEWVLGGIYVPLERLEKKGYLTSNLGRSTSTRGGRSKRLYQVTTIGLKALIRTKSLEQSLWNDISISNLEKGYGS